MNNCCALESRHENSPRDDIANVNFHYDDIAHVLQYAKTNLLCVTNYTLARQVPVRVIMLKTASDG